MSDEIMLLGDSAATGVSLPIVGVIVAGVLVALCIVFAVISAVKKKKKGGKAPANRRNKDDDE